MIFLFCIENFRITGEIIRASWWGGLLTLEMTTHINIHTCPFSAGKIKVPAVRTFGKAAEPPNLGKMGPELLKPLRNHPRQSLCLTGAHLGQSEKEEVGLRSSRGNRWGGSDGKGKRPPQGGSRTSQEPGNQRGDPDGQPHFL